MKENILLDKTFAFAVRTVRAYKFLADEKREFVLSELFLRSGTSIGANVEEAIGSQVRFYFEDKYCLQRGSRN